MPFVIQFRLQCCPLCNGRGGGGCGCGDRVEFSNPFFFLACENATPVRPFGQTNMYDLLPRLRSVRNLWANECWTLKLWLHSGIEVRCTKYDFNQATWKLICLIPPQVTTHYHTHVLSTYEMSTPAMVSAHFPRIFSSPSPPSPPLLLALARLPFSRSYNPPSSNTTYCPSPPPLSLSLCQTPTIKNSRSI